MKRAEENREEHDGHPGGPLKSMLTSFKID